MTLETTPCRWRQTELKLQKDLNAFGFQVVGMAQWFSVMRKKFSKLFTCSSRTRRIRSRVMIKTVTKCAARIAVSVAVRLAFEALI